MEVELDIEDGWIMEIEVEDWMSNKVFLSP